MILLFQVLIENCSVHLETPVAEKTISDDENESQRVCLFLIHINVLNCSELRHYMYMVNWLKDKSGVDKIIVKKLPYLLLNTNREFCPSFDAFSFHKLDNDFS